MGRFAKFAEETITFEIEGEPITLRRLPVKFLKEIAKLKDKTINEESIGAISDLVLESLKKSYPNEPVEELEILAMRYFSEIFERVVELNFGKEATVELKKNIKSLDE